MSNVTKWIIAGVAFLIVSIFVVTIADRSAQPERSRERAPAQKSTPKDQEPGGGSSSRTEQKQAYVEKVAPLIMDTADVMEQVSQSLNDFGDGKISGKEAAANLHSYSDKLSSLKVEMENLTPPSELQKFQELLISGVTYFEKGAEKAASGIEQSDPGQLEEAATLFEKGTEEINKANEEFENNTRDLKTNRSYDFNI